MYDLKGGEVSLCFMCIYNLYSIYDLKVGEVFMVMPLSSWQEAGEEGGDVYIHTYIYIYMFWWMIGRKWLFGDAHFSIMWILCFIFYFTLWRTILLRGIVQVYVDNILLRI